MIYPSLAMAREQGKLEAEPTRPLEADWWREIPIIEPTRPFRWVRATILGVIVLFAVAAGGGYYWFSKLRQGPALLSVTVPLNAAANATDPQAAAVQPSAHFAVGLPPLTIQQADELATTPVSAHSAPPAPDTEPPNALPQPRPVRKVAPPVARLGVSPSALSSPIKF